VNGKQHSSFAAFAQPCRSKRNFHLAVPVLRSDSSFSAPASEAARYEKEHVMDGNIVGLAAVIMIFGIPIAALYTYYRVRKLRTEERLAAIARGVSVPMEPELSQAARTRRSGILLVSGAVGYTIAFALIARAEPDAWIAAAFGVIPLAIGLGCFLDSALVRRDLRAS
jgi:hypothetical protein